MYNVGTRTGSIQYIVIHDTGNTSAGATAQANVNYFNGGDRQSSADYFIDDRGVVAFNPDIHHNYTWHCGDGRGAYGITNANSVGIEICVNSDGKYSQAVTNAVNFTRALMSQLGLGIDRVVRHYDASRKNCPASMSDNNWANWINFKNRVNGVAVSNVNVTANNGSNSGGGSTDYSETSKIIQQQLNDYNNAGLTVDGYAGARTIQAIRDFQAKYGLTVDGIWGNQCAGKIQELFNARIKAQQDTQKAQEQAQTVKADETIKTIQQQLNDYDNAGLAVDGFSGEKTTQAIKNFQSKYGLIVDGIWGNQCATKIQELFNARVKAQQDAARAADEARRAEEAKKAQEQQATSKTLEQRVTELEARIAVLENKMK